MQNAAKNKSRSPAGPMALRVLLLLVVALCLGQTRVWGFAVTPQPASGVFESVTPSSIGENYDGCPYDASDSLLAAKMGAGVLPSMKGMGATERGKVLGGALAVAGVLSLSGELTGPGKRTALNKAGAAAVDAGLQKSSKEIVKESVNAAEKQVAAKSGPLAADGAKLENLSPRQLARIQAVAEKRGLDISVVGSRAEGTADGASDWDYILKGGNSKARHSAMRELPSNPNASKGGDFRLGSEDLRGVDVDPELPHINFTPTKK